MRIERFSEKTSEQPIFLWIQLAQLTDADGKEGYADALKQLDRQLEEMFAVLNKRNREAVVAIVGSYGMMLGEHNRYGAAFGCTNP